MVGDVDMLLNAAKCWTDRFFKSSSTIHSGIVNCFAYQSQNAHMSEADRAQIPYLCYLDESYVMQLARPEQITPQHSAQLELHAEGSKYAKSEVKPESCLSWGALIASRFCLKDMYDADGGLYQSC